MSELEKQDFLTLYKEHLDLKRDMRCLERDVRFYKIMTVGAFALAITVALTLVLIGVK